MKTLSIKTLLVLGLLAPAAAFAQPTSGTDCPPELMPPLLDANDVCSARIIDIHTRILALGQQMCESSNPASSKAAEEKLAEAERRR